MWAYHKGGLNWHEGFSLLSGERPLSHSQAWAALWWMVQRITLPTAPRNRLCKLLLPSYIWQFLSGFDYVGGKVRIPLVWKRRVKIKNSRNNILHLKSEFSFLYNDRRSWSWSSMIVHSYPAPSSSLGDIMPSLKFTLVLAELCFLSFSKFE